MRGLVTLALVSALGLTACSDKDDLIPFDGHIYRAKLSKVDKQRDQFSIEVQPASASLKGAREAGRYEATRYCIANYGSSDIIWVAGPDDAEETLTVSNDRLMLRGACVQ